MRKFNCLSASLVAAFSFGLVACGDDPATGTPDGTTADTTPDTTPDATETTPDTAPDTTPDVEVADPCVPNPCTAKAPTCNAAGEVVTYGAGACAAGECTYAETKAACGAGSVCSAGACVTGGDACNYTFDKRVSYVTEIKVASKDDDCCFDFTEDGKNDNAFGGLLVVLSTFFDINGTIADQIASGSLVLLLETKNVSDITTASGVTVNGFYGLDADTDATNNASGTAEFLVNRSSFVTGTTQPLISFTNASITASVLSAGPSVFRLSIPLLGTVLDLAVDATRLESVVAAGANGADGGLSMGGTDGGRLGGYVAIQSLANAFNTYLDASCTCIKKADTAKPYLSTKVVPGKVQLDASNIPIGAGSSCTGEGESSCQQIASFIGLAGTAISPDIDGDDDGIKESISIGVFIHATSAKINGVDGCTP